MEPESITVTDAAGAHADVDLVERTADGSLELRGADGRRWQVPAHAIARRDGADLHVNVPLANLETRVAHDDARGDREVVSLVEEQLVLETRARPTATVRVRTHTHEREETIDETLTAETVDVQRVPIGRYVDAPASVRVEGDTTIVPVHEEVLVVEKRLLLKEELHVAKRTADRHETRSVTVRHQTADVERTDPDSEDASET